MKFYRVHLSEVKDGSHGFQFFSSRREAEIVASEWEANWDGGCASADIDEIEITPTKAGILKALNSFADHAKNG